MIEIVETINKMEEGQYAVIGKDSNGMEQYGYPPKRAVEVKTTTLIYSQLLLAETPSEADKRVEDIIKAANGFKNVESEHG